MILHERWFTIVYERAVGWVSGFPRVPHVIRKIRGA